MQVVRVIKYIYIIICSLVISQNCYALTYDELKTPAAPAMRLGTDNVPEKMIAKAKTAENTKTAVTKKLAEVNQGTDLTYADLSLKKIAEDVAYELDFEQETVLSDLATLWAAAAQNSETVKYTIYKLSNPEENKPEEGILKKILKPLASFSTIAGTAFSSNPFMASGALIGGNLLSAFTTDKNAPNYRFTKVNDADMVILVRKIDDLQKRLMVLYIDYITKQGVDKMAQENLKKRELNCKQMQNQSREQVLMADAYFRNAQSFAGKASSEYITARNILGQLVGMQTMDEIEARKMQAQSASAE